MQSEINKITLDKTFEEQDMLNENIVKAINEIAIEYPSWNVAKLFLIFFQNFDLFFLKTYM